MGLGFTSHRVGSNLEVLRSSGLLGLKFGRFRLKGSGFKVHIGALFAVLGRLRMTISHSKSKAILTCRGKGAESLKRRFIKHTKMDVSCGSIMPRKLLISLWLIALSILVLWLVMGPLRIKHWSTDYKLVGVGVLFGYFFVFFGIFWF